MEDVFAHGRVVDSGEMAPAVEHDPGQQRTWPTGSLSPIFDRPGVVGGVCAIFTDDSTQQAALPAGPHERPPGLLDASPALDSLLTSDSAYQDLYDQAPDMHCSVDARSGVVVQCNQTLLDKTGFSREEVIGHPVGERYAPECEAEARVASEALRATDEARKVELRVKRKDDGCLDVSLSGRAVRDAAGRILAIRLIWRDVTDRRRTEQALRARERQQSAVADLGRQALYCTNLQTLFDAAVSTIADVLGVDYCKVMELCPAGKDLLLRAGVGWHSGVVGHARVDARVNSQAGYTLVTNEPVIVEDLRTETRFSGPALLLDHAVISGLSCLIGGPDGRSWGVLGAHTRERRVFTNDDVNFVTAIANVLAALIERQHFTQALHEREADLNRAQQVGHIGSGASTSSETASPGRPRTTASSASPRGRRSATRPFLRPSIPTIATKSTADGKRR